MNFLPEYRALHDAGYNVLAYDIRNFGLSGQRNGGITGIGLLEYRDVIGLLQYTAARPDTRDMSKVLLSVCLGADSTAVAWSRHPEEFAEIQAMVMLQRVSARPVGGVRQGRLGSHARRPGAPRHHDPPEDVQSIYDALPVEDKDLHWIEGTERRFDGYNYIGEHPEVAIDWFDSHVRSGVAPAHA